MCAHLRVAPKEVPLEHPKKRRGSRFTKLLWQCANLPFQLLDLTIFYSFSSITRLPFADLLLGRCAASANVFTLVFYCSSIKMNRTFIVAVQPSASGSCAMPTTYLGHLVSSFANLNITKQTVAVLDAAYISRSGIAWNLFLVEWKKVNQ